MASSISARTLRHRPIDAPPDQVEALEQIAGTRQIPAAALEAEFFPPQQVERLQAGAAPP